MNVYIGYVGVRDLRSNLSSHLRQVRAGSSFVVTDHGKPIATLTPYASGATPHSKLDTLIAEGIAIAPQSPGRAPLPTPIEAAGSVTDLVEAQRS